MGKKSAPKPPDPVATAQAQAQFNSQAAQESAQLNQINQVSPFGQVDYTGKIGDPDRTQTTTFSPGQQGIYDQQTDIQNRLLGIAGGGGGDRSPMMRQPYGEGGGGGLVDQVADAYGKPFSYEGLPDVRRTDYDSLSDVRRSDYSSLPELANPDSYGDEIARMERAVYDRALNQLQPQFDRQQNRMNVDLANRGLPIGSEASADARNRFDDSRGRQLTDLSLASVLAGSQEHGRLADLTSRNRGQLSDEMQQRFAQDSGWRGQQAAEGQDRFAQDLTMRDRMGQERLQERQMPYQELASLLGAAPIPQNPSFAPTSQYGIQAPDFMGASAANYAQQAQQHQQSQSSMASLLGGLGSAAMPLFFSDRRLKTDARKVGKLDNGLDVWLFRYKGDSRFQIGVMADEVTGIHPEAVADTPLGFQMVDYERAVA